MIVLAPKAPFMTGMFRTIWQKLRDAVAGQPAPREMPDAILHDPAKDGPHDLDDPFHDAKAQKRVGDVIANSVQDRN